MNIQSGKTADEAGIRSPRTSTPRCRSTWTAASAPRSIWSR